MNNDDNVILDANRFQLLKKCSFNRTVNGFDGKVLTWTLTLPADEYGDGTLEEAVDSLANYHGFKPVYVAPDVKPTAWYVKATGAFHLNYERITPNEFLLGVTELREPL